MKHPWIQLSGVAAFALALGACASEKQSYLTNERRNAGGSDVSVSTLTGSTYVEPRVVYVEPETYSTRTYFFESNDVDHVYYYDPGSPDTVIYRQVYWFEGRPYYVEHAGDLERRIYFNDRLARERRFERAERDRLLRDARERELNDRRDWEHERRQIEERREHADRERRMQEERDRLHNR